MSKTTTQEPEVDRNEYMERFNEDLNDLRPTDITADGENYYPVYKFGARWVCDGPNGRFHAKTKQALVEMLKNDGEAVV